VPYIAAEAEFQPVDGDDAGGALPGDRAHRSAFVPTLVIHDDGSRSVQIHAATMLRRPDDAARPAKHISCDSLSDFVRTLSASTPPQPHSAVFIGVKHRHATKGGRNACACAVLVILFW
jgi:hypothetical protein